VKAKEELIKSYLEGLAWVLTYYHDGERVKEIEIVRERERERVGDVAHTLLYILYGEVLYISYISHMLNVEVE
jgi:hypothetical protein